MLKKIFQIFKRDVKVNSREFISLYIILFPIILAIGINLFAPDINDTTISLALLENDNKQIDYLKDYANIELYKNTDEIEKRVNRRDAVIGIALKDNGEYYILSQGNEPTYVVEMAKLLKSFYELDLKVEDTNVTLHSFERTVPPLKKMLVNCSILMISVLGGMLITINLVEEKADNTISAIIVSPISRIAYILGKCIIGVLLAVIGSILLIILTGFTDVNFPQSILAVFSCTLISVIIGFLQGISSDDVMEAIAGIKMMFLPMAGAIAAIQLLSDKWQRVVYWIPFYWTFKGNDAILSKTATWPQILTYTSIVLGITLAVFLLFMPKIRKGLEK
ncbi:ABC transporter permease [Clostridiaceae bacterium M8S5]|nr:ABC transporter permease [Clostridiaceae bacterium M8S5]